MKHRKKGLEAANKNERKKNRIRKREALRRKGRIYLGRKDKRPMMKGNKLRMSKREREETHKTGNSSEIKLD